MCVKKTEIPKKAPPMTKIRYLLLVGRILGSKSDNVIISGALVFSKLLTTNFLRDRIPTINVHNHWSFDFPPTQRCVGASLLDLITD